MLKPQRRSKGTVMTLPPTPRTVAMAPMPMPPGIVASLLSSLGWLFAICSMKPRRNRQSTIVIAKYTTNAMRNISLLNSCAVIAPAIAPRPM
ncbi:hypothetical protein D3C87_1716090 [compost metagenome]